MIKKVAEITPFLTLFCVFRFLFLEYNLKLTFLPYGMIFWVEDSLAKTPMTAMKPLDDRPRIMGILNVTPDSFSDGGAFFDLEHAVRRGLDMVTSGADIVDVGGESTRPGSDGVSEEEEMKRVVPVIDALARNTSVPISVDTVKPAVAEAALAAGARIINDVSGLRNGDEMARLAKKNSATLVLMHSRGTPKIMAGLADYYDVVAEVRRELLHAVERALFVGVKKTDIWIDPGIGFAKRAEESLTLMNHLEAFVALQYPVLVGPSRKSFIGEVVPSKVTERVGGTAAAVTVSVLKGVFAVRVHDVYAMRQAAMVAHALRTQGEVLRV